MSSFDQNMMKSIAKTGTERLREVVDAIYARDAAMQERDRFREEVESRRPVGIDVMKIIPRGPLPPQGHRTYRD